LVNKDEDYVILVRLTEEDFSAGSMGTVYILYGNQINSTLEASKYLLCHTDDLIKRTKKNKHFFIVFKVKKVAGVYHLNFNEYRDLTDEIFPEKSKKRD